MPKRRYVWDTVNDCVLQETDESGTTVATYTHEPGAYGPLVSQHRSGQTSYSHFDAVGNTRFMTDDAGNVTDSFTFDASGNEVARTGTTETPYRWCGRWGYRYDIDLGSYYVRARIYQPTIARWLSEDELAAWMNQVGHSSYLTRFAYCRSSPTFCIDPSGLATAVADADAFIPWDWVNIPPDPRAVAWALLYGIAIWALTESYVEGDNRNPSPTPLRARKTRVFNYIDVDTCSCNSSGVRDAETDSGRGINRSTRKDIFYFPLGYTREHRTTATGTLSTNESASTWAVDGGCYTVVRVRASGNVPYAVAVLRIPIDYVYGISFYHHGNTVDWTVFGQHDGFPGHEFYLRMNGAMVDRHAFTPPGAHWVGSPARLQGYYDPQTYRASGSIDVPDKCECKGGRTPR